MAKKVEDGELSVEELLKREQKFNALMDEAIKLFPDAHRFAKEDRVSSVGRMGLEEATVLRGVVDVMEARPALFECLADEDEGHDPNKLETGLLRDRFAIHGVYARVAAKLGDAARPFADTALKHGELVKPVTLAAYQIAKPISKRDAAIRGKIAAVVDYYAGRKGSREEPPKDG
ncbi:MAG: hypothetical protein U0441_26680 [Polyangiaceae bacterium]